MIHVDTCFLIDFNREMSAAQPGPVAEKLADLSTETFAQSVHVAAELYAGAEQYHDPARERRRIDDLAALFTVVYPDERFAPTFGKLAAYLRRSGQPVAPMDLLIATAAIVDDAPLLTRDGEAFRRIPGLEVLEY